MNDPIPDTFNHANAKELVLASAAAYAALETGPDIIYSSSTDTLAVVTETATDLFVVFRGTTKNFKDWLDDIDIRFTTLKFGGVEFRIHTGFYEDVMSVWPRLSLRVAAAVSAGKRVWLGGHSKGGADAKVAAWLLWRLESIRISGIYTCGEPRSMGRAARNDFETYLGDRSFRVIDAADLVTRIPLPPFFIHDGDAVFFDGPGESRDGAPFWWMFRKVWLMWFRWVFRLRLIGFYDHHVALYVALFP